MPTGYTGALYEGDQSLRDYLMGIGRGMGYAIHQRDEGAGPVTEPAPSTHNQKWADEADEEYEAAKRMTPGQALVRAEAEHAKRIASDRKWKAEREVLRARYNAMLAEVEAWQCDPLMESTKDLARTQLVESIAHDCGGSDGERMPAEPKIEERTPQEWRAHYVTRAYENARRCRKRADEEIQRNEERARYFAAFASSLPSEGTT